MKRWIAFGAAASPTGTILLLSNQASAHEDELRAVLRDPAGVRVGTVNFSVDDDAMAVRAVLKRNRYVTAGALHGFHVHANNDPANGAGCVAVAAQPSSTWFVSADGHLAASGQTHGNHTGDMPSPLVLADGTATLRFSTDRIDPDLLSNRAVILHAGPDNFGNVPTGPAADQYTPNSAAATDKTQNTGNAGDRVACGIVRRED